MGWDGMLFIVAGTHGYAQQPGYERFCIASGTVVARLCWMEA